MVDGRGAAAADLGADGSAVVPGTVAPAPSPHHPIPPKALAAFCTRLNHDFVDLDLLGQSLTHRSWCAEHAGFDSNERLEFLGDAVLGVIVTDDIYRRNPEAGEGQLSRIRASVVCAPALAEMAVELGLGEVLLLGKGEAASGGRERPSILADAMEAVIGAVYLDGGQPAARRLVERLVSPRLVDAGSPDHKSRLHELVAQEHGRQIRYELTDDGPEHDKTFRAVVFLDEEPFGTGSGRSKKQAEQAAAQEAWQQLGPRRGDDPVREESDG
ncbi:ribonuclease III [Aquihabitans sp. G128]|uniref:ribonuclease III n=1 Tax=Aquihabitans sp. G128 TaxID=2849779 RepID=UPI001C236EF9|nr:ribonuclease III [Aquihabitans sp. G128]QXC62641.1 ribonuclease III [Aquihabitans sp. G128]